MKVGKLLYYRINLKSSFEFPVKIISAILSVLAACFLCKLFDLGLIGIIAVGAAAFAAQFYLKLYRSAFDLPLSVDVAALAAIVYFSIKFSGFIKESDLKRILGAISFAVVSLAALLYIILLFSKLAVDKFIPKRIPKALLAVFPLFFTTLIYIPSETYFNNHIDFLFLYTSLIPLLLLYTLIYTAAAVFLLCILKEKLYDFAVRLSVGLTLGVYCQYIFMNGALPSAIGDPVEWDTMHKSMVINAVIWILILLLPFAFGFITSKVKALKNSQIKNAHLGAAAFIGTIQLVSLIAMIFTTKASFTRIDRYMLSNEEQFTVSANKNIITILIDMADRNFFDAAQKEHPEKFECLNDFTYYNNACMMYDSTVFSIPQMLSGTTELPGDDYQTWAENAWTDEPCTEFYSRLHENNYKVNTFGDFSYDYAPLQGKIDNCHYVSKDEISVDHTSISQYFRTLSAFRYLPLCLKSKFMPAVYSNSNFIHFKNNCIFDNQEFIDSLDLKADSENNYFVLEHVVGTHGYTGKVENETLTCLDLVNKYLEQLKKLGVYDNSVIIITSDHGKHYVPDNMPIWYIKNINEHHDEMQYCNAPIHHSDYLATVLDTAGLTEEGDEALFGRSIYQIGEDEDRERLVFQTRIFPFVGAPPWKEGSKKDVLNCLYGYYFRGGLDELVEHETNDPPDIFIEVDSGY